MQRAISFFGQRHFHNLALPLLDMPPYRKENLVSLDLKKEKGVSLARQEFDWRDIVRLPTSKLDSDAFTRVRIILMNGIESEALRFQHACARMNKDLQLALARVRRVEQHQQTMINWLLPADLHRWRRRSALNRSPSKLLQASPCMNRIRIWRRSIALACSRISITCTGLPL